VAFVPPKRQRRAPLSYVRLEVRAVILLNNQLVVCHERQVDGIHMSLPGGRVKHGEGVLDALVREVHEETGLTVRPGRLLYVAEARSGRGTHDLNLVFRATPSTPDRPSPALIDLDDPAAEALRPPVIAEIRLDAKAEWKRSTPWLGNIWSDNPGSP
jgi:8-oxo-dGTP pyrophosphatase MutT (NUDIX family)